VVSLGRIYRGMEQFLTNNEQSVIEHRNELIGWLYGFSGVWGISIHLKKPFADRKKTQDYQFEVKRVFIRLRNQINREFGNRYNGNRPLCIGIIEGLGEFESTHFHLILGDVGTNNKQRVTKRLTKICRKIKEIDVDCPADKPKRTYKKRVKLLDTKDYVNKCEDGIQCENVKVIGIDFREKTRSKGVDVKRIKDIGWAEYIEKEVKKNNGVSLMEEFIQLPTYKSNDLIQSVC